MSAREWKVLESRVAQETGMFVLRAERCRHPSGMEHVFWVIEVTDWCNVLPLTDAGDVVLLKQWRHGTRSITVEIPGGMAEPGESPERAAERELREETGYGFRELVPLGHVTPNPAIQNNRCWLYVAAGARPVGPPEPDETEDLEILTVPLAEALDMVRDGRIHHTMVVNAFLKLVVEFGPDPGDILRRLS